MTEPALAHSTPDGRFYTHPADSREVPSITNVKDIYGIGGLKYWAANECAGYAADNIASLKNLDRDDIFALVKKAPWSRKGKKAQSSLVGDIVHDWINQVITGAAVSDIDTSFYLDRDGQEQRPPIQAKWTWNQFAGNGDSFLNIHRPEFVYSEFTVWSDKYDYAGTMDWCAKIGKSRAFTLADNKTGGKVYDDMALQLAAGAFADYILLPDADEPSGYRKMPVPEFERFGILHLRPRGWSLVPIYHIPEAFKAFLGLRAAFEWKVNFKDSTIGVSPKYEVRANSR